MVTAVQQEMAETLRMPRLRGETLERMDAYADRILDVTDALSDQGRSPRIVHQIIGAGTSVGANIYEASEAMSRADFNKCLAIAVKELNECHFWLKLCLRRGWFAPTKLSPLLTETIELKTMFGAMLGRSRKKAAER